ncbi:CASP8 protein, partial [Rhinopomastus cyanomelas]|nr:CASP8 protein [Rhinopomastus cyanomelas]
QRLLLIGDELGSAEVAALKFLSLDYIPMRRLEAIRNAQDFFEVLEEKGLIEAEDLGFLRELLYRIGRIDLLVGHLGSSREAMERELQRPGKARVSPYRRVAAAQCLLFHLSEDIISDERSSFKFLLGKELPKYKQNPEATMLDVFTDMEKKGILGEGNLNFLKKLCEEINLSLSKRIEEYQVNHPDEEQMVVTEEQGGSTRAQEDHARWLPLPEASDSPGTWHQSSQLEAYKMTSRPRGVCVIVNNHNFEKARTAVPEPKPLKDRNGTDVDAAALSRVFSKLHFEIREHKDLTAEEILKTVNSYRCEDHRDRDCFVCCVLSHGKKGSIYGVDGEEVPIQKLTTCFTGQNCHSLAGKPKVFFVQACQGEACHRSVVVETDSGEQDSSIEADARFQLSCIPAEADFLLGMATLQDYVSYRSPSQGTWYIQALCQHLESSCPRGEDILTILTAVNQEVSRKSCNQNSEKQMPQPSFTLRKRLIFPVN